MQLGSERRAGDWLDELDAAGVQLRFAKSRSPWQKLMFLRRAVRDFRPDLVLVDSDARLLPLLLSLAGGQAVVLASHSRSKPPRRTNLLLRWPRVRRLLYETHPALQVPAAGPARKKWSEVPQILMPDRHEVPDKIGRASV